MHVHTVFTRGSSHWVKFAITADSEDRAMELLDGYLQEASAGRYGLEGVKVVFSGDPEDADVLVEGVRFVGAYPCG